LDFYASKQDDVEINILIDACAEFVSLRALKPLSQSIQRVSGQYCVFCVAFGESCWAL